MRKRHRIETYWKLAFYASRVVTPKNTKLSISGGDPKLSECFENSTGYPRVVDNHDITTIKSPSRVVTPKIEKIFLKSVKQRIESSN